MFLFLSLIFGLMIGSFLNCLIWRLHESGEKSLPGKKISSPRSAVEAGPTPLPHQNAGQVYQGGNSKVYQGGNSLTSSRIKVRDKFIKGMLGRSYCPKCKKQIAWYDNIPVLSFIILRGKCRHCGKGISWQYPVVEITVGVLFALSFLVESRSIGDFGFEILDFNLILNSKIIILKLLKDWFVISVMTVIFVYDLRWYLILDIVTLPAGAIVFAINLLLGFSWLNLLISGIIGGSFFLIQFIISQGRWMGGGDIRLGLLMGLALGWPNVLVAIFIAYFMGSIVGIGLKIWAGKKWDSKVPLGTFLSVATIITLFWGQNILDWYLNLIYIK